MAGVVSIHRAHERSAPAEPLAAARILPDFGLEGDFRSARPGRHVTLIEEETLSADRRSATGYLTVMVRNGEIEPVAVFVTVGH